MITGIGATSGECNFWLMGELPSFSEGSTKAESFDRHSHLYCSDLDPCGIPPPPFPTLYAHGTQTKKRYSTISFSQLDSVSDLR